MIQKSTKKMRRKPPDEKLRFSIFWVFRDIYMMVYAVGILLNICACNLTSKLAGRNLKYYAIPSRELTLHPNIAQQTFFNHAVVRCDFNALSTLARLDGVDLIGLSFDSQANQRCPASVVFIILALIPLVGWVRELHPRPAGRFWFFCRYKRTIPI